MKTLTLLSFLTLCAFAADTAKPVASKTAPAIAIEHRAEFYRADAQFAHAQQALEAASKERDAAVAILIGDCGEAFAPAQDPADSRKLACVAKVAPPAK